MAKKKTVEDMIREILENNPQVDEKRLVEGLAATQRMRIIGRRRRFYGLSLPTSRKRVRIQDDDANDPRTIRLLPHP